MSTKLIFNSEENYSNSLCIVIDDNINKSFIFDKITITNILDQYIELDLYTDDIILIDKLEILLKNIKEEKLKSIKCYPDSKKQNTYFVLQPLDSKFFENKKLFRVTNLFKFYCKPVTTLYYEGSIYKEFKDEYNSIANDVYLNEKEREYVSYILEKQKTPHWFNDQNILVEEEHKRILSILNKQNIKSTNGVFDPSILKIINGPTDPMLNLSKITGLENVKHEIEKLKYNLEYQNKRANKGSNNKNGSLHMCFYGNPGTGKTTIARIMTGLLFEMGYIKKNRCVEVNGLELKGSHIGQAATITKGITDFAKGGVLFIDEAYTLNDDSEQNFGKEVINTLLKEMEDSRDELIIIFAGYKKPMDKLLDTNSGFRSRIKKYFDFEDYNTLELAEIFVNLLRNKHLIITKEALEKIIFIIKNARKHQNFGNGRYIHNLMDHIEELHILNVEGSNDYNRIDCITIDDVEEIISL